MTSGGRRGVWRLSNPLTPVCSPFYTTTLVRTRGAAAASTLPILGARYVVPKVGNLGLESGVWPPTSYLTTCTPYHTDASHTPSEQAMGSNFNAPYPSVGTLGKHGRCWAESCGRIMQVTMRGWEWGVKRPALTSARPRGPRNDPSPIESSAFLSRLSLHGVSFPHVHFPPPKMYRACEACVVFPT